MSDEPQFETQIRQFLAQMGGASLSDRMGERVLPEWIDVIDRPREKQWNGVSTLGAANYDDEGVATRDTTIVSHGVLKAMLATRIPSEDASATTGSAHGLGASPSNLYTVARKTSTETELRQQLLAMAKERGFDYGIVVRDIGLAGLSWVRRVNSMADNNGISIATGTGIYKVFADGHEEQIRDVEFAPVTTTSLKEIVAAGDKPVLHESPFIPMAGSILAMAGGGGLGGEIEHVCSFITPSLLVDDLTLKHTDTPAPNGPTVPSPLVQQTAMK
jgi:predicted Zn-dependent protease